MEKKEPHVILRRAEDLQMRSRRPVLRGGRFRPEGLVAAKAAERS
jgi:hypothetical protein